MLAFQYTAGIVILHCLLYVICTIDNQFFLRQSEPCPFLLSCTIKYCNTIFNANQIQPSSLMVIVRQQHLSPIQTIIMESLSSISVIIFNKPSIGMNVKPSASNYLIFIDTINEVAAIETIISSMPRSNSLAPIVVIFSKFSATENGKFQVKTVFERLRLQNYFNLYAILIKPNTIEIVSWYPYENGDCARFVSRVKTIEFCNKTMFEQENVLTTKMFDNKKNVNNQDTNKCSLKVLARIWEPYVCVGTVLYGIDIDLLEFILESVNMVPIYYKMNKTIERKTNYVEGLTKG